MERLDGVEEIIEQWVEEEIFGRDGILEVFLLRVLRV
jgi:hypothetical protein